jgi:hypothetical protein
VTVGISAGNSAEITQGLRGGEQVVVALDPSLAQGEAVNIVRSKTTAGQSSDLAATTRSASE